MIEMAEGPAGGANVTVNLDVENFELVAPQPTPAASPGASPAATPTPASPTPMASPAAPGAEVMGAIAYTLLPGPPVILDETEYTWENVPPGPHTLRVELVDPQGQPLSPETFIEFQITVPQTSSSR